MPNDFTATPASPFPPERVSAAEQAGGALVVLGATGLASLLGWLTTRRSTWLLPLVTSSALASGLLWIFRNPARQAASRRHAVLAPNDGTISSVTMLREERFLHGPAMRITIQVALHHIQVMRSPLTGVVRARRYEPGDPTHQSDDSLWLGIKSDTTRIAMRQVVNRRWRHLPFYWIRRVLCWADLEESLQAGQVIGHLTLGGTAEVYIPCTATIRARAGQPVVGGVTVLATLPVV